LKHRLETEPRGEIMKLPPLIALVVILVCAGALPALTLTRVEYFFDSDPGPGNGTQLFSRNTLDIDELIDSSALAPGIHRLYVRARNNLGLWSLPQSSVFYIPFPAAGFSPGTIESIEYFYDTDPGPGNGNPVYERNTVALDELLDTSVLEAGIHRLYVRARNTNGLWSLPQCQSFLIPWTSKAGSAITRLEYFIDTDPGFGNAIQVTVTPGASIAIDFTAIAGSIEHGNHCLYVRGKNTEGSWGLPACCQFSDGVPADLTLSIDDGMVTLTWEDLCGIDTYNVYSAPLYSEAFSVEQNGTFGASSWISPVNGGSRFYRVTSTSEE
jgi:hypothetical protein